MWARSASPLPASTRTRILELSHLAEKTRWGRGFTAWLQSLIPLLGAAPQADAVESACAALALYGTLYVGNITGSLPAARFWLMRPAMRRG